MGTAIAAVRVMKGFDMDYAGRNLFQALRELPHIQTVRDNELVNTATGEVITECPDSQGYDYATFCVTPPGGEKENVPGHHYLLDQCTWAALQAGAATDEDAESQGRAKLNELCEKYGC
jgi:hypothetical protein